MHPYQIPERLETERLVLLKMKNEDAQLIFDMTMESIEILRPWMVWAQNPTLEKMKKFVTDSIVDWDKGNEFNFIVFEKGKEGVAEGFVECMGYNELNPKIPAFDIGYWCRKSKQGKGYVKEIASFLTEYGMEKMGCQRLQIRVDTENEASNAVARYLIKKHAYVLEGVRKNDTYFDWLKNPVRSTNVYVLCA